MNKITFSNYFKDKNNERIDFFWSKLSLAENTYCDIEIGEFVTGNIYDSLLSATNAMGLNFLTWDFYEDCERKFCMISHNCDIPKFSVGIIKIKNKSKFIDLRHKDYLGAVMSLDIKREKFGDLLVKNDCCYIPVTKELIPYITTNLNKIKNCPCEVCIVNVGDVIIPAPEFQDINVIVSAMRIDCVLAELSGKSRVKSLEYLKSGKVLINYLPESKKDKLIEIEDIITIRGIGKFKIASILCTTQKDRLKLLVNKFL